MKHIRAFYLAITLTLLAIRPASAQSSPPICHYEPSGEIVCTTGGGGGGGGGGGNGGGGDACTPGTHMEYKITGYDPASQTCSGFPAIVDNCTGQIIEAAGDAVDEIPCTLKAAPPSNPCVVLNVGAGGITCEASRWNVTARVSFPQIFLDVRPYPVTLVRWPTAVRNGGLNTASGSGRVDYVAYGGGSPGRPQEGDWRDLRLTLTLSPAADMFVFLPRIGQLILPNGGEAGSPRIIKWETPSHPAAGGGPLAGAITGLNELPADMPLFVGHGRAPYMLSWELSYYEYAAIAECVNGPDGSGSYNCGGGSGHREITGYEWRPHREGGAIPPSAVDGLPPALAADLNGDGVADAYWDNNLTLRRMDDNNRVDNPRYARSWNWGGTIYWAVREGQGQIGWPGQ